MCMTSSHIRYHDGHDIITHTISCHDIVSWHHIRYHGMILYIYTGDIITLRANIIKISLSHRSTGLATKRYQIPCSENEKYLQTDLLTYRQFNQRVDPKWVSKWKLTSLGSRPMDKIDIILYPFVCCIRITLLLLSLACWESSCQLFSYDVSQQKWRTRVQRCIPWWHGSAWFWTSPQAVLTLWREWTHVRMLRTLCSGRCSLPGVQRVLSNTQIVVGSGSVWINRVHVQ